MVALALGDGWPEAFNGGLAAERHRLDAGGLRLSYLDWGGDGQPVLLLHGITSSAHHWWRVAPRLAEQGYRVLALDMPGHGWSDETEDHRVDSVAAIVGQALRLPVLAGAALIGHSWGGAVALAIASGAHGGPLPERVALVDPALQLSAEWGLQVRDRYLADVGLPFDIALAKVQQSAPHWHAGDQYARALALSRCRAAAGEGFLTGSGTWDVVPRLDLPMPLLLLLADPEHTVVRPEAQEAAARSLRGGLGQIVTIPGAEHGVFRSRFEPFLQVLLPWMAAPID